MASATEIRDVNVRYHDTDAHDFGKIYDSRVVASVKLVF